MKEQKSKHLVGYCINFFNNVATNAKGSNTSTIVERVLPHTSIYLRVCTIYMQVLEGTYMQKDKIIQKEYFRVNVFTPIGRTESLATINKFHENSCQC